MTYPQIGNVGVNPEDDESERPFLSAFVVKEVFDDAEQLARARIARRLPAALERAGHRRHRHARAGAADPRPRLPERRGLDRSRGSRTPRRWSRAAKARADRSTGATSSRASPARSRTRGARASGPASTARCRAPRARSRSSDVVAFDFGIKRNILRLLVEQGFDVTVVPARTPAERGARARARRRLPLERPGRSRRGRRRAPSRARARRSRRADLRHLPRPPDPRPRARRHDAEAQVRPPRRQSARSGLATRKVAICAENHGFAVDAESLRAAGEPVEITHVNLNDGTVEGLAHATRPLFSVQYHPEASPGPARRGLLLRALPRDGAAQQARRSGDRRRDRAGRLSVPKRTDIHTILVIGSGPDRDRPGLRVRLLGHAGLQGAARGGLPRRPGQLEPGDDHDRPGDRRPHLRRADDGREPREDHRARAARRAAADDRRPDGAQPRARARRAGVLAKLRRRADRRAASTRSTRPRTASCSAPRWRRSGSRVPRSGYARSVEEARAHARRTSACPAIIRPSLHAGRHGRRHRLHATRSSTRWSRWGLQQSPRHADA